MAGKQAGSKGGAGSQRWKLAGTESERVRTMGTEARDPTAQGAATLHHGKLLKHRSSAVLTTFLLISLRKYRMICSLVGMCNV